MPICITCHREYARKRIRPDGECENCHRWVRYHTDEEYRQHVLDQKRAAYQRHKQQEGRGNDSYDQ